MVTTTTKELEKMKEYVKDKKEFLSLVNNRIHWAIRRTPVKVSDIAGRHTMTTGEYHHILSVTSLSPIGHIVLIETDFGIKFPNQEDYSIFLDEIKEYVEKEFPEATEGAWSQ
jgi:hypothetical protein